MRTLLVIALLLLSRNILSQPITIEIPESQIANGVAVDDSTFLVRVNHLPVSKQVIYKLNLNGDVLWSYGLQSTITHHVTTIPHNCELPLTPDGGCIFVHGIQNSQLSFSKINVDGHTVWNRTINVGYNNRSLVQTLPTSDGGVIVFYIYITGSMHSAGTLLRINSLGDSVASKSFFTGSPWNGSWDLMAESDSTFLFAAKSLLRLDLNFNQIDSFEISVARFIGDDADSITFVTGESGIGKIDKAFTQMRRIQYPNYINILDARRSSIHSDEYYLLGMDSDFVFLHKVDHNFESLRSYAFDIPYVNQHAFGLKILRADSIIIISTNTNYVVDNSSILISDENQNFCEGFNRPLTIELDTVETVQPGTTMYNLNTLISYSTASYNVLGGANLSNSCSPVGVTATELPDISIYPNPFNNEVHIDLSGLKVSVKLWSNRGELLLNQYCEGNCRINADSFEAGLYLLQVCLDGKPVMSKKLMRLE